VNPELLKLREFLRQSLREAGDSSDFGDSESLFVSGRLDSLALTRLVLFMEEQFGIDFGRLDFSAELVDSVEAMAALVPSAQAPARSDAVSTAAGL
jgi:acyl carrier protein